MADLKGNSNRIHSLETVSAVATRATCYGSARPFNHTSDMQHICTDNATWQRVLQDM
jgi:hypothetical protein